jgi:murein DD-endopeptidase MepM/ murein hydrolase activator NlpD
MGAVGSGGLTVIEGRFLAWMVVVIALALSACGDNAAPTTLAATTTTTATTTSTATTTTTSTTTTTAAPATTTTTLPVGPWQVEGRRYYFPLQPPEAGTYADGHHDYPATDIFAPEGTTVVAVTSGIVDEVGLTDTWDPAIDDPANRAGLYVTIIGEDGVRYHASHLASVEPGIEAGVEVRAGQVIGTVGATGNARQPHLHFGISRPTFPGDWEVRRGEVSPYEYLQAWTRGEDLTPVLPEA